MNLLSSKKRSYGTYDDILLESASDSTESRTSSAQSLPSGFDEVEASRSLLARTAKGARILGAKRKLSGDRSRHDAGGPGDADSEDDDDLRSVIEDQRRLSGRKWSWPRRLKVSVVTCVCVALTILLLFFPEEVQRTRVIEVQSNVPYTMALDETYSNDRSDEALQVSLTGSFVPEEVTYLARDKVTVWVTRIAANGSIEVLPENWTLGVVPGTVAIEQSTKTQLFDLGSVSLEMEAVALTFIADTDFSVPLLVAVQFVSNLVDIGIALGGSILVFMYALILFDVMHRTVVTMLCATIAIGCLALLDERPSLDDIIQWIDTETLTLLFSMMIIVSLLSETGVFNAIGLLAFRVARGKTWPMLAILCFMTASISALLDNVTTILLMTPVIIQLCEVMNINPRKVLIANVIFSNIGGAATAIGDPPNVLIASDIELQDMGITFTSLTVHMIICTAIVAVVAFALLRLMYGGMQVKEDGREIKELRHEIMIWHKTAQNMSSYSMEEVMVRTAIYMKIEELMEELETKKAMSKTFGVASNVIAVTEMESSNKISDKPLLVKTLAVLFVTVILFFLSNFPEFNLSLGWTALLGALTLLVLADKLDVETVFSRVEWSTLIFFATLFVVMEALNKLGLLLWIGQIVESAIEAVPENARLPTAITMILWVSGLASAFIDNIPFTTMMIPIIKNLSMSNTLNLPLQPMVWSLALGACLGGNGTLIGASANVVCAGVAEQHGYKFSFLDFFKVGFPITLASLVIATAYLLVCHVAFSWNG